MADVLVILALATLVCGASLAGGERLRRLSYVVVAVACAVRYDGAFEVVGACVVCAALGDGLSGLFAGGREARWEREG